MRKSIGGFGGMGTSMLGMGALGVAIAAFDHFVVDKNKQQSITQSGYPQQRQYTPQPAAVPIAPPSMTPPPPPPGAASVPTPPDQQPSADTAQQALLLIRAMIAAANADGAIDAGERNQIVGRLKEAGLSSDDRNFILNEFLNPPSLDDIVKQIDSPELAKQAYAVSLFAIEVDTEAEKQYMDQLAIKLSLNEQDVKQIEDELGLNDSEGE
ncbi:tellurite resistance TerB family protein [bacterium]|nr:tellurite resistance TerB family protein [bacterium]